MSPVALLAALDAYQSQWGGGATAIELTWAIGGTNADLPTILTILTRLTADGLIVNRHGGFSVAHDSGRTTIDKITSMYDNHCDET